MKKDDVSCVRWTRPASRRPGEAAGEVRDRMTPAPVTIRSDASLGDAIRLLVKHNIRELPVVDRGRLVGIITDRDIRQVSPSYPLFRDEEEIRTFIDGMKVSSAMSPEPLVIAPTAAMTEAAALMIRYRIGSLPVVYHSRLVGIISVTDVLKLFVEQNGSAQGAVIARCRTDGSLAPGKRPDSPPFR
jgi:acetoin utilization protein AcuB